MPRPVRALKSNHRDEIRRLLAVQCLASVFEKGEMAKPDQEKLMFDLFVGNKGEQTSFYFKCHDLSLISHEKNEWCYSKLLVQGLSPTFICS